MSYLERGQLLIQQSRYTEAEQELQQALALDPQNAMALGLMSICAIHKQDFTEALQLAELALSYEPIDPFLIYVLSRCYFLNNRFDDAKAQLEEGLSIYPHQDNFFLLLGEIAFHQEDWEESLNYAHQGLEIDPEHLDLINLRARSLVQLNRKEEARATMDYALHTNPEDPYSHANKGWVAINQNEIDSALEAFQEALRLDPENDYARNGLKEAIKAQNLAYRLVLQYFLWMGRMNEKHRWTFVIGIYILYRVILYVAKSFPAIAPVLYPLVFVYILFAFSSWVAVPFSNFVLRFHKLGRYAMDRDELRGSTVVGSAVIVAIVLFGIYYFLRFELFLLLGGFCTLMLIPLGATFSVDGDRPARKKLGALALILASIGLGAIFIPGAFTSGVTIFAFGILFFSFAANYIIGQDNRRI
ncbi:MAG: tetratricopeptide repeat protein [Bacteroidota bacterium]